ncbi:MAG: SPOR domain-containing protein [Bdellovibrionaceae bacterium]|nr:SPOR domain-containing protein [Pseudobdellovibrionaceae bacterium]
MKKGDQAPKGKKENRLEKVIVFMLVVLISLLSFSVGVISGKGLSDKQFALNNLDKKHEQALNNDEFKDDTTGDLSEEEIQQLANAALQAAEKGVDTEAANAPEVAAASKEPASAAKVAPAVVAKTTAPATTEEDRQPTSVKKQPAMNLDYTVQVASYPSLNDAEMMSTSLVKKGFPAFPIKVSINGQDWYRVSVGSFKTKKEAMDYQVSLKKQGVVKDAVVQKFTK